jgi:hypothetical protein
LQQNPTTILRFPKMKLLEYCEIDMLRSRSSFEGSHSSSKADHVVWFCSYYYSTVQYYVVRVSSPGAIGRRLCSWPPYLKV